MSTPKFATVAPSVYAELKHRVQDYFHQHKLAPTGNLRLYLKAFILLLGHTGIYTHLVFFTPAPVLALLECILLGLFTAGIGFNVMHDGAHHSFSRNRWINRGAALTLDLLGASSFMWHTKHNIVHHTYTNIEGVDDDIRARPFLRLAPSQKHYKMHRYQHLYFWFFYSLLYLAWIFYTDYKKYFSKKVGSTHIRKLKISDHILFWSFKILHLVMYILLPIYLLGFGSWLPGFLLYAASSGLVLSIVFQLAHTVEETSFPELPKTSHKMEDEWALHQLKTTANFATGNKIITWFVGGLNYQIEHHLFPRISHIHYPAISKIIKRSCREMGLPYIEHRKMSTAIASHISHLQKLGAYSPGYN